MGKVIPTASAANFGIEELSTAYAVLTKNGIATAESGTYLRSMLSELTKSGSETDKALRELSGKGFAELKKEGKPTTEIFKMLSEYAEANGKTLKDMFGSVEAGSAAMVLASGDGKEFNEILDSMGEAAGATQEAFDKIDSSPAERIARALNRAKNKAIEMGDKLLPVFEKVIGKVESAVDWFTGLDDETQELYIRWGLGLAAAGPLITGLGGILKVAGGIPKVFGLVKAGLGLLSAASTLAVPAVEGVAGATAAAGAASGGLATGLGAAAAAAAPWVLGAGAIAGAGYLVYKGFQENATPAVDRFADTVVKTGETTEMIGGEMVTTAETTTVKISEETRKQGEAYFALSDSAQQATMEMYAGIMPVTDENIASITGKVDEMSSQTIQAITKQKEDSLTQYQELFSGSTTLTAEQKQQILTDTENMATERVNKVTALKEELLGLYEEIKENGIGSSQKQRERIAEIYDELAREEIKAVARSKNEQEVLLGNLEKNKSEVTSKMLEDTISKLNEERDKGIAATEEKYNQMIEAAVNYKTDLETINGELTAEQQACYDAMIKDAERYKTETEASYDNLRNGGIKRLYDAFPELTSQIDIETGKQLSYFSKLFGGAEENARKINGLKYQDKSYTITRHEVTQFTTIYQSVARPGRPGVSYAANGIDYVPHDGYRVHLHRGERVLTEKENKEYSSSSGRGDINIKIEKVENNTKEDVRNLVRRIGDEIKRQNLGRGQMA